MPSLEDASQQGLSLRHEDTVQMERVDDVITVSLTNFSLVSYVGDSDVLPKELENLALVLFEECVEMDEGGQP